MFFSGSAGVKYVDRGDPVNFDFLTGAFTDDGTWRELDLSSIIGSGVKAVHLRVRFASNSTNVRLSFRKKGNTNGRNVFQLYSQTANVYYDVDGIVVCDSDGKIEYNIHPDFAGGTIEFLVGGWWV